MIRAEFDNRLNELRNTDILVIDTEGSNFSGGTPMAGSMWDGRDYGIGFAIAYADPWDNTKPTSAYFPWKHKENNLPLEWLDELRPVILEKPLVFHNAPYDVASLWTMGIDTIDKLHWDTIVMAHLCNEELPNKGLDWLAKFIFNKEKEGEQVKVWAKIWGWHTVPVELMAPYSCIDAELTWMLFKVFYKEMQP